MKRRSFLQAVAGLVLSAALPVLPRRAEPLSVIVDEEAALPIPHFETGAVAESFFPFFWDAEVVSGLLAVPLLDILVAF